jgi:hypothetical protein
MSSNLCKGELNCTTKGSKIISLNEDGEAHIAHIASCYKDNISIEKPFENSYTSLKKTPNTILLKKISLQKEGQTDFREENMTIRTIRKKKKVKFKTPFIDLVDIESYKSYNELMTYSEYSYMTQKLDEPKKNLCESIMVCAKKVCVIF